MFQFILQLICLFPSSHPAGSSRDIQDFVSLPRIQKKLGKEVEIGFGFKFVRNELEEYRFPGAHEHPGQRAVGAAEAADDDGRLAVLHRGADICPPGRPGRVFALLPPGDLRRRRHRRTAGRDPAQSQAGAHAQTSPVHVHGVRGCARDGRESLLFNFFFTFF